MQNLIETPNGLAMITRDLNGRFKTMQEMLAKAIGPASAETMHGVGRAPKRDSFLPGARRSLQQAFHRVCGAASADERLSFRAAARGRLATAGYR